MSAKLLNAFKYAKKGAALPRTFTPDEQKTQSQVILHILELR